MTRHNQLLLRQLATTQGKPRLLVFVYYDAHGVDFSYKLFRHRALCQALLAQPNTIPVAPWLQYVQLFDEPDTAKAKRTLADIATHMLASCDRAEFTGQHTPELDHLLETAQRYQLPITWAHD